MTDSRTMHMHTQWCLSLLVSASAGVSASAYALSLNSTCTHHDRLKYSLPCEP